MPFLNEDFCVMCGSPVPEGRMVCPYCEQKVLERTEVKTGEHSAKEA